MNSRALTSQLITRATTITLLCRSAALARAVYTDDPLSEFTKLVQPSDTPPARIERVQSGTMQGLMALWEENKGEAFLVVRGTDERADWTVNLDTTRVPLMETSLAPKDNSILAGFGCDHLAHAAVHHGFTTAAGRLWPTMAEILTQWMPRRVNVTGHSLGGAVAVALGTRLLGRSPAQPWFPLGGVVTFGAPRFGNAAFAAMIQDVASAQLIPFIRVVNNNDLVTRVPPRIAGYRHAETDLLYFTEDGALIVGPSPWWAFLDKIHGAVADLGEWGLDGVKDHAMENYHARIEWACRVRS